MSPAQLLGSALLAKTDAFFALGLTTQPEQELLRLSQNPWSKR